MLENRQYKIVSLFAVQIQRKERLHMESKIIAMAGKGGVGKTSLAASMVKVLVSAFSDKKN